MKSVLAMILYVAPGLPYAEEAAFEVARLAEDYEFQPATLVQYVETESGWNASAMGRNGDYIGLGQIRAANYQACWDRTYPREACEVVRQALQDWKFNLQETARLFWMAREYCADTVRSSKAIHWMQLVKGYDKVNGTTCGHVRRGKRWVPARVPPKVRAALEGAQALSSRFR